MDINLQGKMSQAQYDRLKRITELVNARLPACDHKTPERVWWDFGCAVLDMMTEHNHNHVLHVDTDNRDPQRERERAGL